MKYGIHKEGHKILLAIAAALLFINLILFYFLGAFEVTRWVVGLTSVATFVFAVTFFRIPKFVVFPDRKVVIAPADGKVVAVEIVEETEYFKDKRIQVSIFMSPANVHVNRSPICGTVKYTAYHPGNYMVAWHPKSSTKNERFTTVIEHAESEVEILVRQIAGKVARKITNYMDEGQQVLQGNELGFIKFGSRVDIFLPIGTDVKVNLKEKVKGGKTVLALMP